MMSPNFIVRFSSVAKCGRIPGPRLMSLSKSRSVSPYRLNSSSAGRTSARSVSRIPKGSSSAR